MAANRRRVFALVDAGRTAVVQTARMMMQIAKPASPLAGRPSEDFILALPPKTGSTDAAVVVAALAKLGVTAYMVKPDRLYVLKAKFDVLLHLAERAGIRRTTLSGAQVPFSVASKGDFAHIDDEEAFFTSAERLFLLHDVVVNNPEITSRKLDCFPRINLKEASLLSSHWVFSLVPQPYAEIRAYLGEEITFYFAFLGTYTSWLTLPTALGLGTFWYQYTHDGAFDNAPTVLYSLFLILWTTVFLEAWKRKQCRLAFEWGTDTFQDEEEDRPEYLAACKVAFDAATRTERKAVPWTRTAPAYVFSLVTCSTLVVAAAASLVACLQWADYAREHWTHWSGLWRFAVYVPTVVYSLLINAFGAVNKALAVFTTELELHRTESEQRDAVAVKLVALQFVNMSAGLAFCAFYKMDLDKLRTTLATLLIVQQVVGQFFEVGLPLLKAALKPVLVRRGSVSDAAATAAAASREGNGPTVAAEVNLETYAGVFGDYLEMWIQLGQVTLFAAVFPLAGLMALLNNVMEIRTDAFKIVHASRRPFPRRAASMGSWLTMFELLSFACVLSNVGLMAVIASKSQWFRRAAAEYETWQLALAFVLVEHAVVACKLLLRALVGDVPEDVASAQRAIRLQGNAAKAAVFEQRYRLDGLLARLRSGDGAATQSPQASEALALWVAEVAAQKETLVNETRALQRELQHLKSTRDTDAVARFGPGAVLANVAIAVLSFLLIAAKAARPTPAGPECLYSAS